MAVYVYVSAQETRMIRRSCASILSGMCAVPPPPTPPPAAPPAASTPLHGTARPDHTSSQAICAHSSSPRGFSPSLTLISPIH